MLRKRVLGAVSVFVVAAGSLAACSDGGEDHADHKATFRSGSAQEDSTSEASAHEHHHAMDGGQAPAGMKVADKPKFAKGSEVTLLADHMPGMKGAKARIVGAYTTTTYEVSYTPTDGGEPVKNHRWVVHEELVNPGDAPLKKGVQVEIGAEHMQGMKGAKATIDDSTQETVYIVDVLDGEMPMTNHKWFVESEMKS